jgi:two-component system chemotaxis response regulator CheY
VARIVIVDDNLMVRTLLREILDGGDHQVVGEAADGLQAESKVRALRPDLVTLDLGMPVRGGLESLPYLLAFDPPPAVVVCSALLNRRRVIAALRSGAVGFIVKPFDRQSVLASVDEALAQAAQTERVTDAGSLPGLPIASGSLEIDDDQREFGRVPTGLSVRVTPHGGPSMVTVTVDVSGSGLLLSTGRFAVGTLVDFCLQLSSGQGDIEGRARVARIDDAGRPALAFEQVSVDDHERLIAHIQANAALI